MSDTSPQFELVQVHECGRYSEVVIRDTNGRTVYAGNLEKQSTPDAYYPPEEPDGSVSTKIGLYLDTANVSGIVLKNLLEMLKKAKSAHYTNIETRINGEDVMFEADWIKYLEYDESQFGHE